MKLRKSFSFLQNMNIGKTYALMCMVLAIVEMHAI